MKLKLKDVLAVIDGEVERIDQSEGSSKIASYEIGALSRLHKLILDLGEEKRSRKILKSKIANL